MTLVGLMKKAKTKLLQIRSIVYIRSELDYLREYWIICKSKMILRTFCGLGIICQLGEGGLLFCIYSVFVVLVFCWFKFNFFFFVNLCWNY